MKLRFEFLTVFRQRIGRNSLCIHLADRPEEAPTVLEALEALEKSIGNGGLRFMEAGGVARGLLVFRRTPAGALERIRHPENQRLDGGQNLVLSVAMEGG